MKRPQTLVVLAMSLDGKIADSQRSAARFSSATDRAHLERQLADVDAALFGAGTLRAYGTTLPITNSELIQGRQELGKPPQPIQIVCSASGQIDPNLRFFRQPIPRWLITTPPGAKVWSDKRGGGFERILLLLDWNETLRQLTEYGIEKLAILGGGELIASLLAENLIDEFWLTICPIVLGGVTAPTPVAGVGFLATQAHHWALLSVDRIRDELFLHYRRQTGNRE